MLLQSHKSKTINRSLGHPPFILHLCHVWSRAKPAKPASAKTRLKVIPKIAQSYDGLLLHDKGFWKSPIAYRCCLVSQACLPSSFPLLTALGQCCRLVFLHDFFVSFFLATAAALYPKLSPLSFVILWILCFNTFGRGCSLVSPALLP